MKNFRLGYLFLVLTISACDMSTFSSGDDDIDPGTDNADAQASVDSAQGTDASTQAADVTATDSSTADTMQGTDAAPSFDSDSSNDASTDVATQADSGLSFDLVQNVDTSSADAGSTGTDAASGTDANSADVQTVQCVTDADCAKFGSTSVCKNGECAINWCKDGDGDGFVVCTNQCLAPPNILCGDCNDNDPSIHPGAKDICDGIDNNCDGVTDNGTFAIGDFTGGPTMPYYEDTDGDGYGNPFTATIMCSNFWSLNKNSGWTDLGGDCDDKNPSVHPNAKELCDSIDNDCNSKTDEAFAELGTSCGNGICAKVWICSTDKLGTVCPGESKAVTEICGNNLDDNCDGQTDENCAVCMDGTSVPKSALVKWYKDLDGDTFAGTTTDGQLHCPQDWQPNTGWYTESLDCDDANPMIHPGAFTFTHPNGTYEEEFCNGKDDNCDGQTDEGFNIGQACVGNAGVCQVTGKIECGSDPSSVISICSVDKGQSMSQAVTEVCGDNLDNDCDGVTDNGCVKNNSVECKLLGGTAGSDGYCKTFCDSCKAFQTCLDVNKDGIADTCEDPPTDGGYFPEEGLIALRFKNLGYAPTNIVGTVHYYKSQSDYTNTQGWDPVEFGSFFDALNFYAFTELGAKFNDPNSVPDVCGMQFNASIFKNGATKPSDWLCEGSGVFSHVIDGAQILYLHHDVFIDITLRVTVWQDPDQNGCNITIPDKETCPLQNP